MGTTEDQDLTIQRRSLKWWGLWRTQFLKNILSIFRILKRNYVVMNEEDDEVKRRILPMKQIKTSIQLSFHDIVLLCICLYTVDVLCMIECLHQWQYNTNMHVMGKQLMVLYNSLVTCSNFQKIFMFLRNIMLYFMLNFLINDKVGSRII